MNYEITHVSYDDGSPAMMVSQTEYTITLINECGDQWSDPAWWWIAIGNETQADYDRWADLYDEDDDDTYTSGEQFMADYLNSDSNIAYLNGY